MRKRLKGRRSGEWLENLVIVINLVPQGTRRHPLVGSRFRACAFRRFVVSPSRLQEGNPPTLQEEEEASFHLSLQSITTRKKAINSVLTSNDILCSQLRHRHYRHHQCHHALTASPRPTPRPRPRSRPRPRDLWATTGKWSDQTPASGAWITVRLTTQLSQLTSLPLSLYHPY